MTCETCNGLRLKLSEAEYALRLIALYSGDSDPADSEGLAPRKIADAANTKLTDLCQQLTAAQERVKELDRRNESNEAVLGMQHAVIADLRLKLEQAEQRLFNRNKEIDELIVGEKTCGELSCDECNERFVLLKVKLAEVEKARDEWHTRYGFARAVLEKEGV